MLTGFDYDTERPDKHSMADMTPTLEEYTALFANAGNARAIGESPTGYLPHPSAPMQIQKYIPDAKLIAILRDPVERAHSLSPNKLNQTQSRMGNERSAFRSRLSIVRIFF